MTETVTDENDLLQSQNDPDNDRGGEDLMSKISSWSQLLKDNALLADEPSPTRQEPFKNIYKALETVTGVHEQILSIPDVEDVVVNFRLKFLYVHTSSSLAKWHEQCEDFGESEKYHRICLTSIQNILQNFEELNIDSDEIKVGVQRCHFMYIYENTRFAIVCSERDKQNLALEHLVKAEELYHKFKNSHSTVSIEKFPTLAVLDSLNSKTLQDMFTYVLFYLGQAYKISGSKEKALLYLHTVLRQELEKQDTFSPISWASDASKMANVIVSNIESFEAACNVLLAATAVMNKCSEEEKNTDNFKQNYAELGRCWVKVGNELLAASCDRLKNKDDIIIELRRDNNILKLSLEGMIDKCRDLEKEIEEMRKVQSPSSSLLKVKQEIMLVPQYNVEISELGTTLSLNYEGETFNYFIDKKTGNIHTDRPFKFNGKYVDVVELPEVSIMNSQVYGWKDSEGGHRFGFHGEASVHTAVQRRLQAIRKRLNALCGTGGPPPPPNPGEPDPDGDNPGNPGGGCGSTMYGLLRLNLDMDYSSIANLVPVMDSDIGEVVDRFMRLYNSTFADKTNFNIRFPKEFSMKSVQILLMLTHHLGYSFHIPIDSPFVHEDVEEVNFETNKETPQKLDFNKTSIDAMKLPAKSLRTNVALIPKLKQWSTKQEEFPTDEEMRSFIQINDEEREKNAVQCPVCLRWFSSASSLRGHILVHNENAPTCPTCGKKFPSKAKLQAHNLKHTGERPFVCPQCERSYTTPGALKRHSCRPKKDLQEARKHPKYQKKIILTSSEIQSLGIDYQDENEYDTLLLIKSLNFPTLDLTEVREKEMRGKYVRDFQEARSAFLPLQRWINVSKAYYCLEEYASDYIDIMTDYANAFKHISFFEPSLVRQAKMHKRRILILEDLLENLSPTVYYDIYHFCLRDIAEINETVYKLKVAECKERGLSLKPKDKKLVGWLEKAVGAHKRNLTNFKFDIKDPVKDFESEYEKLLLGSVLTIGRILGAISHDHPLHPLACDFAMEAKKYYEFFLRYLDHHQDLKTKDFQILYEGTLEMPDLMEKQIRKISAHHRTHSVT